MMRDTLSHRDLRTILNKNKITNQKKYLIKNLY
jgi:hypothetical protein